MSNNEILAFAEAVRLTLAYCGAEVFDDPQKFVAYLYDMTDDRSEEMRVLKNNCTAELLAPFRRADTMTSVDLKRAAATAQGYLAQECLINADTSRSIAQGIAQGVARWRGISLSFEEGSRAGSGGQSQGAERRRPFSPWLVALLVCGALGATLWLASGSDWWPWHRDKGIVVVDEEGDDNTSSGFDEPADEEPEEQGSWDIDSSESDPSAIDEPTTQDGYSSSQLVVKPMQTGPDGYVLPQSDTHRYTKDELSILSNWELYIARNEIPARSGMKFANSDLDDYFSSKSWYHGTLTVKEFQSIEGILNEIEEANVDTILALEVERDSEYRPQV